MEDYDRVQQRWNFQAELLTDLTIASPGSR